VPLSRAPGDDGDIERPGAVGVAESATAQDRDLHGREEIG
jgi:hypothetical protein